MSIADLVARAVGWERVQTKAPGAAVETPYTWPLWRQGQPDWTPPTLQGYAAAGYSDNAIVYACIAAKAQSAALAPLVAYAGERDEPERLPDAHPLAALLLRPNAWQSWYEFQELLITYLELDGNAFIWKAGGQGGRGAGAIPSALFPLRSDRVRPVPGRTRAEPLLGYVYDPLDENAWLSREPFLPEEIIHVKYPNPADPFEGLGRGTSPLCAAAKPVDVDNSATSFLKTFFDNAVAPFGLLKSKQKLVDTEVTRIRERLRAQYGGVMKWGDVMILDADAEYQRLGLSMQEMTFSDLDFRNEARICMVLRVPPIIVGARVGLERSTFANYAEARSAFWEDSLVPGLYRRFEDGFNSGLANGQEYWLAYDYSKVPALREDVSGKWEVATRAFLGGLATRSEARALVSLPAVDPEDDGFRATEEQQIGVPAITQTPPTVKPQAGAEAASADADEDEAEVEDEDELEGEEGGKARRPFVGRAIRDDGGLRERLGIEARWAPKLDRALRAQLRAAVPAGMTPEQAPGAEQRLLAAAPAVKDVLYGMLREAALAGLATGTADVDWLLGGKGKAPSPDPSPAAAGAGKAEGMPPGTPPLGALGIGIDWTLVNAQVLDWIEQYAFELIGGLTERSRTALAGAITRWVRNGLPLKDLWEELGPTFGLKRAKLIAATEVTRAFAEANLRAWQASGVIERVRWRTANDERVCFPAWTLVETDKGPLPIQDIKPGMRVLTRLGMRSVRATSRRDYSGAMVRVSSEVGDVTATADHPFWTLEQGWLEGRKLNIGHHLETFGQQAVKVLDVHDFRLGDATDTPAMRFEEAIFARVASRVAMPIGAVNLTGDTQVRQQKVNAVAAHLGFLDESDAKSGQGVAHGLFEHVLAGEGAVTGERAKLSVIAGLLANRAATLAALNELGRAATFLRAVVSIEAFLGRKDLAAAFAGDVFGISRPTFSTANGELESLRAVDGKLFAADGAGFRYQVGHGDVMAAPATEAAIFSDLRRFAVDELAADRAGHFLTDSRGVVVALSRAIHWLGAASGLDDGFATSGAGIIKRHVARPLSKMSLLYHRLFVRSIPVYDLEVDGVHEFYANGVLVHNCPVCSALGGVVWGADGAIPTSIPEQRENGIVTQIGKPFVHPGGNGRQARWAGQEFRAPPAHPRCRCSLAPVVEW